MSENKDATENLGSSSGSSLRDKKTCKNKRSFFTESEANKVGRSFNQRSYECPVCYCWHLTSKDFHG